MFFPAYPPVAFSVNRFIYAQDSGVNNIRKSFMLKSFMLNLSFQGRNCAAIGLAETFQRHGLKFSLTDKLLFGEDEIICFGVILKKL